MALVAFNQMTQMFAYSVLIPSLMAELHLTYALAGTLTSAYTLAMCATMAPVGIIGDRLGVRALVLAGTVALLLGAFLFASASNYPVALASRLLVGAGAGVALALPPPVLAYWFNKSEYKSVTGLQISVGKTGSVVATWVLPPLVVALGWRLGYSAMSLVGVATLLLVFAVQANRPSEVGLPDSLGMAVSDDQRERSAPEPPLPFRQMVRQRDLLLLAISQALIYIAYFGMTNWLPTYYQVSQRRRPSLVSQ
ncbi:MAG: MFS transporter [Chloroflexi bacterium]|nr:MFS transporter [Chloroflexota bacterium]MCL5110806.1 MFS transporter [Chloroflexota bacterium]